MTSKQPQHQSHRHIGCQVVAGDYTNSQNCQIYAPQLSDQSLRRRQMDYQHKLVRLNLLLIILMLEQTDL